MAQDIDLLGDYRARHSGNSDFWNMTLAKLASIPELRARAQEKRQEMLLQQQRVQQGQQEIDLRGRQIGVQEQAIGMQQQQTAAVQAAKQKAAQMAQDVQTIMGKHMVPGPKGGFVLDMQPIFEETARQGIPPEALAPHMEEIAKLNEQVEKSEKERRAHVAGLLRGVIKAKGAPAALKVLASYGGTNGWLRDAELQQVFEHSGTPEEAVATAQTLLDTIQEQKNVKLGVNEVLVPEQGGEPVASNPVARTPTEASLASEAAGGDPAKALALMRTAAERNPTEASIAMQAAGGDPAKALRLMQTMRPSTPVVIQTSEGPQLLDKGSGTSRPIKTATGATVQGKTSATMETRLASAQAVNQTGNDIIAQLSDPAVASKLGPIMGRATTLRELIGNPPPEFAEMAGAIESYALANMGVHGMRSVQGAEQIKKLLDAKHTPESLIRTIQGLNKFSTHFMENAGREVPAPATTEENPFRRKPK